MFDPMLMGLHGAETMRAMDSAAIEGLGIPGGHLMERAGLAVLKRDGRREDLSREKLLSGIKKACQKRPIGPKVIEDLAERTREAKRTASGT